MDRGLRVLILFVGILGFDCDLLVALLGDFCLLVGSFGLLNECRLPLCFGVNVLTTGRSWTWKLEFFGYKTMMKYLISILGKWELAQKKTMR